VGRILAHVVREDAGLSMEVVRKIGDCLDYAETDFDRARGLFRSIWALLNINDSLAPRRIQALMNLVTTMVIKNRRYWRMTDYCIQHLLFMAFKSQALYDWFQLVGTQRRAERGRSFLVAMRTWLLANPTVPYSVYSSYPYSSYAESPDRVTLLKRSEYSYYHANNQMMSYTQLRQQTGADTNVKLALIDHILNNGVRRSPPSAAFSAEAEDDFDLSTRILPLGELCEFYRKRWYPARVVRAIAPGAEGRFEIQFCNYPPCWNETISVEDTNLAPFATNLDRTIVDKILNTPAPTNTTPPTHTNDIKSASASTNNAPPPPYVH
jgi:hypothetical protein